MNILLVDDEMIAIEGIMANIDFTEYGIRKVFTANSMEQAKEIIRKEKVEILLCDIEMPNGNGLELIEWVNQEKPEMVTLILSCHTEFQFAQAAVGLSCQQYLTKPATPGVLAKAMTKAVEQVNRNDSDRKIKKIGQDFMKRFTGGKKEEADTAEKVHSYIIENISEELSVEELAAMVYLSQNQLARVFKKKYGKTVIEFIMEYRMNLAEELLKDTRFTVTEVSAKIGYPNYAYFTKLFKKHSGYTPSAYRNRFGRKS